MHTLEQSHTKWQQNAHNPELPSTREQSVERVHQQYKQQVDVQGNDSPTDDRETAYPDCMCLAKLEEGDHACEHDESICDGDGDIAVAEAVEVG